MNTELVIILSNIFTISTLVYGSLAFVLWYFKRDFFLTMLPTETAIITLVVIASVSTVISVIDSLPPNDIRLAPYFNVAALGFVIIFRIWDFLVQFRDNIQGNKIQ